MTELPGNSRPGVHLMTVCLDCRDAEEMAAFYTGLLGWEVVGRDHDFILVNSPDGGVGLSFQEEAWYQPPVWPEEPGEQAKMIHLDLQVTELESAVARALACGGRLAASQFRDDLRVILDPAGHPVCLCLD